MNPERIGRLIVRVVLVITAIAWGIALMEVLALG